MFIICGKDPYKLKNSNKIGEPSTLISDECFNEDGSYIPLLLFQKQRSLLRNVTRMKWRIK